MSVQLTTLEGKPRKKFTAICAVRRDMRQHPEVMKSYFRDVIAIG